MEFMDLLHARAAFTLEKQLPLLLEFKAGWACKNMDAVEKNCVFHN
jgi:hypothetical protein